MDSQLIIKLLLIVSLLVFAVALIAPMRGARNEAIRKIVLVIGLGFGIYAVIFPESVNSLANLIGVGRGTDLLLYVLAILFCGQLVSSSRRTKAFQNEITILAREIALLKAMSSEAE